MAAPPSSGAGGSAADVLEGAWATPLSESVPLVRSIMARIYGTSGKPKPYSEYKARRRGSSRGARAAAARLGIASAARCICINVAPRVPSSRAHNRPCARHRYRYVAQGRYLWTDAHGVCNFVSLALATRDASYLDRADALIEDVHATLGRDRSGAPLGRPDAPLAGGLRIGKVADEGHVSARTPPTWHAHFCQVFC